MHSFCGWLSSLSIMSSGFIHDVACVILCYGYILAIYIYIMYTNTFQVVYFAILSKHFSLGGLVRFAAIFITICVILDWIVLSFLRQYSLTTSFKTDSQHVLYFVYSSTDGHLGHFNFLATVNDAAMTIGYFHRCLGLIAD